ncbi:MAG: DNA mismatch repair protein MutS [Puniceicoccales bacterium]|jgi:DNA mismatch repair protein MutS|nr:DNA mismatch repair protein MutS [Puniceicoccales bacterium]
MQGDQSSTPMMRQYMEIRKSLPKKTLLFFRLGDFYELFNEDARIGARLLGITLTRRGTMPMAGIPYHAAAAYINKILNCGYKIAICDQVGPPKAGQLVERSLSRILTPGTVIGEREMEDRENRYILAIGATKSDFSIAWLEASTGELQIAATKNSQKLLPIAFALNPSEIIIPENAHSQWKDLATNAQESLRELVGGRTISELPDFYFDSVHGANIAKEMLGVLNFDGYGIGPEDYPALGPAGALLHYAEENFRQKPQNIKSMRLYKPQESVQIDNSTVKNLEIFRAVSGQKIGSLVHAIDRTATSAGGRQLEKFLLEPSLQRNEIMRRQNCVRAFFESEVLQINVQNCLRNTYDLPRILTRLQNRMKNPRDLSAVKSTIDQFPRLKNFLDGSKVVELAALSSKIHTFDGLVRALSSALNESNLPPDLLAGGYVRDGYDAKLDEYRHLSTDCKSWISDFERREQTKSGIKSLKVKYSGNFGYFIEVTRSNLRLVPDYYMRRQTTVGAERYVTDELKRKEAEILNSQALAVELEEQIFNGLVAKTLENFNGLVCASEALAQLDVFCGWGELARKCDYCCPEMSSEDCLEIRDGRHPVIEQILKNDSSESRGKISDFTPNDLHLKSGGPQIALITGPNMAGKSTYIRQVALIAIMAHIGCWVPAKKCKLSPVDKIFSRIGSGDDLSRGRSTFMMEMSETANILNNVTDASLVILDEVGRGTSTYDGLSIALAVVEYLHGSGNRGPKTLFATHYHELTKLVQTLPRMRNFQMEVREWKDEIIFLRRVIDGAADKSYGIHVARLAGVPGEVISRAREILRELEEEGNIFTKNIWQKKRGTASDDSQIVFF